MMERKVVREGGVLPAGKRLLVAFALMMPLAFLPSAGWAAEDSAAADSGAQARSAEEVVRKTSQDMLDLISEAQSYAEEDPERFYGEVEALLTPVVDFRRFARGVMGAYARSASEEQIERFVDTFKDGIIRTYALALTDFQDGEVNVLAPERPPRSDRHRLVTMEIRYQGQVFPVVYSLTGGEEEGWKVSNLIVEGVNVGLAYQEQFKEAMRVYNRDLDSVIDHWDDWLKNKDPVLGDDEQGEEEEA